jgi:hypothetical protein
MGTFGAEFDRQLPRDGEIFLDHIGHFVRDPAAAAQALRQVGFQTTPASIQVNPDGSGGEKPAGTGNITAMFSRGYVEALFKTADTPLGQQLDTAMARYPGVHLAAFAVSDAAAAHARLQASGFRVQALIKMQRPVKTATGDDFAAFTIARGEPGEMAEGRIQILTHRTEHTVWQPRWLDHPNGARGLVDVVIVSADIGEAADRFSRFLDRPLSKNSSGRAVALDRGRVVLVAPHTFGDLVPDLIVPTLPFIGLYAIAVKSLDALEEHLTIGEVAFLRGPQTIVARFPDALGTGAWMFVETPQALPWRDRRMIPKS